MPEAPAVPPASDEGAAWPEPEGLEDDDLRELFRELPKILGLLLAALVFLAVVIALVLTIVQLAKFPWLAGG